MPDDTPSLTLLGHQQRQIITELGSMRDDMAVLTAIVIRQDGTLNALLTEIRAAWPERSRLVNRVSDLEVGP